jgi:protein involved in polysaccharide export with SLBB domain
MISGEILYPGKYAIDEKQDRVYDLIKRAGGFTDKASLDHIEFIRQEEMEIKDLEMERLSKMIPSEMSESESRYFQAKKTEKKGSMAIDFNEIMRDPSSINNIMLRSKDSIIVSKKKYHINVQGRVNNPGLITYQEGFSYLDYINSAGGFGFRADEGETIITKPRGEQFLAENMDYKLEPGDVILVPPEKEYSYTELFTTTLTVITQLISIAAIVITISK